MTCLTYGDGCFRHVDVYGLLRCASGGEQRKTVFLWGNLLLQPQRRQLLHTREEGLVFYREEVEAERPCGANQKGEEEEGLYDVYTRHS